MYQGIFITIYNIKGFYTYKYIGTYINFSTISWQMNGIPLILDPI